MFSTANPAQTETRMLGKDYQPGWVTTQVLAEQHVEEVVNFLAERPVHGFFLRGHIEDNGLVSSSNRGKFIGVRNPFGSLEGVALIGHATLFETKSDAALAAIAQIAQQNRTTHMLLGEQEKVERFWKHYSVDGQTSRASCRELLFEKTEPVGDDETPSTLRLASAKDLDLLAPVHAKMAFTESGINPLDKDPKGFCERYLRRINRDRVWVVIENDRLLFKADIALQTSDAAYLEGIHVHPEVRGMGYGHRFLSQLSRILLRRVRSICLLVNENNIAAHALYRKAGFGFQSYYRTIFLHPALLN